MASSGTKRPTRNSTDARMETVSDDFQRFGDAARRIAADGAAAVRDTAFDYLNDGRSRVRHIGEVVQSRVGQQPIKSLLIAAGIGFLLGAIWTRR